MLPFVEMSERWLAGLSSARPFCSRPSSSPAKDADIQQAITHQPVAPVDPAGSFACHI
jgi:hypothetical protein